MIAPSLQPRLDRSREVNLPRASATATEGCPCPEPCPPSSPSDAAADIDFTQIDTPQKAALVPSLQPSVFLATMNAMANASGHLASLAASLQMQLGQATEVNVSYAMPAGTGPVQMFAQGKVGDQDLVETWSLDSTGLHITGTIGANQEDLTVTQTDKGLAIQGQVGTVVVRETVKPSLSQEGVEFNGYFDQKAVHQVMTQGVAPNGLPEFQVRGYVGCKDTDLVESTVLQTYGGVKMQGQGEVASTPILLEHSLELSLPSPSPIPFPGIIIGNPARP